MENTPVASSNPRLRKPKKTPKNTPKEATIRRIFQDTFIKNPYLEDQLTQGNLKDVFEEIIDFKKQYSFQDKTFSEVLNYSATVKNNKKVARLLDEFITSSNEGEFSEKAVKILSTLGVNKAIEVQPNQGFKDLNKKLEEEKVMVKEKEKEKETETPVLEASKEPKKEKQTEQDKIMELVGLGMTEEKARKDLGLPTPTPKPSTTTGKIKAFTDKEIDDMMKKLGVSKKEAIAQLKLAQKMDPPTFSPEQMTTAKEDIAEEKKAQAGAKAERPTSGMTEEEVDEILGTATEQEQQEIPQQRYNENVKMEMKKPDMRTEIDDLQPLPSKSDFIPPMRIGTSGKDIKDLLDDIMYFMKNFKGQLKRESAIFKEVDKTNIEQLRKLHNKIVGKLAPKQKKEEGKKVGIIVNADEYIREQMKKILAEQVFSNLRPQDVVIDVGSRASEGRDTKDFGDFAIKRTIDGGLASTREAVFRYMPSENDQDVGEEGKTEKQRKKPNRISMPKSRLNNERTNAIKMNVRNPFRVPQKTMKLKYLY